MKIIFYFLQDFFKYHLGGNERGRSERGERWERYRKHVVFG
jgi:hypothetical protein